MGAQPKVEVVESTLVFPPQQQEKVTVPLSILDATVTHYAPCSAVWFFDAAGEKVEQSESFSRLQESLRVTLSSFPHFAGELSIVKHNPEGDHTQRYGRLQLTFGSSTDPGVEFSVARCALALNKLLPTPAQRKTPEFQSWNMSCSASAFLPDMLKIPFIVLGPQKPAPPILIQATQFACGGISIGVRIAHPLADAHTLAVFMHRWSYEHSILTSDSLTPPPSPSPGLTSAGFSPSLPPTFNPQLLDTSAAGDINAESPDEGILEKSRALPSARYDWFWPAPDSDSDRFLPPGLTRSMVKSPGTPMPTADWDHTAPLAHTKLHFSAAQLQKIHAAAGPGVSRHDALLAHVWAAVNRARGWSTDTRDVSLHIILGLRRRLGLPSSFLGSPIISASVTMKGQDASGAVSFRDLADGIRGTLALYTEDAVRARLHDLCFECAPQRFWEGYLGSRHVIFSSWAHLHLYEVDFGGRRGKPRHVEVQMPEQDGMVWLMEGRPEGKRGHWCDDGVDVALTLAADAVERLKADSELW